MEHFRYITGNWPTIIAKSNSPNLISFIQSVNKYCAEGFWVGKGGGRGVGAKEERVDEFVNF